MLKDIIDKKNKKDYIERKKKGIWNLKKKPIWHCYKTKPSESTMKPPDLTPCLAQV
jgi:hypothetical protein